MKASKLDKHREFITKQLQANISIAQLRRNLIATKGCSVSRSHLTDWIKESGITYTPRKPGRPRQDKRQIFQLLPHNGDTEWVGDPRFALSFQGFMPLVMSLETRKCFMTTNDLPPAAKLPKEWPDLEGFIDLTDVELMILAYFRSDLEQPPVADQFKFHEWFVNLCQLAVELRDQIEEAWAKRKS